MYEFASYIIFPIYLLYKKIYIHTFDMLICVQLLQVFLSTSSLIYIIYDFVILYSYIYTYVHNLFKNIVFS